MKIKEQDGVYYCAKHDVLLEREADSLEFICPEGGEKFKGKEVSIDESKTAIKIGK